jgi:hypothetical protein
MSGRFRVVAIASAGVLGTALLMGPGRAHAAGAPVGCAVASESAPAPAPSTSSCTFTTVSGKLGAVLNPGMAINVTYHSGVNTVTAFINPACALPPAAPAASANCPAGTITANPASLTANTNTVVTVAVGVAGTIVPGTTPPSPIPAPTGSVGGAAVGDNPQ